MFESITAIITASPEPSLAIGPDLRVIAANAAWRRLHLPGGSAPPRERIDKLFPEPDAAACVLDVLASGVPSEHVAVRFGGDGEERFLCASFYPFPPVAKPKKVLMQAFEMNARLLLDGETGEILDANEAADAIFGRLFPELLQNPEARTAALAEAARSGSHYLGRFHHRRPDGSEVELESLLAPVDSRQERA